VIVADNGSTDESRAIARGAGARVIDVPELGYGAALRHGIDAAQFEYVVFADADMSYPFTFAAKLLGPLDRGDADLVLGSRLRGSIEPKAMPFLNRHLGTPVLSFFIRVLFKLPTSDCNSGMRAIRKSVYEKLRLRSPGMEFASEMLVKVGQMKFRYAEVPIAFRRDARTRPPHLRRWRDGWRHLRFILANGPIRYVVTAPLFLSATLLSAAFLLSFKDFYVDGSKARYHTAFLLIGFVIFPMMLGIGFLLTKFALYSSEPFKSKTLERVRSYAERQYTIVGAMIFGGLMFTELSLVFYRWYLSGFGDLSEMGSVIRLMVYSIFCAGFLALDVGIGIIHLIKKPVLTGQARQNSTVQVQAK
jgi:glycosyltransferase involved in cell wall biosynthesis